MAESRDPDWKHRWKISPEGWSSSDSDGEKENKPPSKKRPCLSLKKTKGSRFQPVSPDSVAKLAIPNPPKNTKSSTSWAVRNLNEWYDWHNSQAGAEQCPVEFLSPSCTAEILNKWLQVYVAETRNKSGQPYLPKTLYALLAGILRHMTSQNPRYPNFLEQKCVEFVDFHRCMDNLFRKLRESGVGADCKHCPTISIEEENRLWSEGILNVTTLRSLLRAVFYYNGKNFILCRGQEHRDLKDSQLVRLRNPDQYIYTENVSKNRAGGIAQLHLEHKQVPTSASSIAGDRCHVRLLDLYISKLPSCAKELLPAANKIYHRWTMVFLSSLW